MSAPAERVILTNADSEIVWRVMRFQHSLGQYVFGWRINDDLIALSYPMEDSGCESVGRAVHEMQTC